MRTHGRERFPGERTLIDAARHGDEEAFRRVVDEQRAGLQAHCFRMLGSLRDAEDAVQETMVRAWRGLPGYQGRSSVRTWLRRIATNVCLDAIGRRPARGARVNGGSPAWPGQPRETAREPQGERVHEALRLELDPDEQ